MTLKEKQQRIAELEALIVEKELAMKETKKLADQYNAMQLALKIVLNGSYGAFANKHFVCFCNGVAATITAHGRDLIQYMESSNEHYWYNMFHDDTDLHKEIAIFKKVVEFIEFSNLNKNDILNDTAKYNEIKNKLDLSTLKVPEVTKIDDRYIRMDTKAIEPKPIKSEIFVTGDVRRIEPVSAYCDTDSLFVTYKPVLKKFNIKSNQLEAVQYISKIKLAPFFKQRLDEYATKYKVENIQDFEMEQISKSIIYLEKKMYIKNVVWEEGVYSEPETDLQAKGIDLVRSSSPAFVRDKEKGVYRIIKYFFKNPDTYNDRELVKLVRDMKDLFKLAPIEQISMSSSCSNYDEKVIDDQDSFKIVKGAHHAVKAAALHNYLLNQNSEYKQKYNLIKSGQKIKYYHTDNNLNNEFAYMAGQYPKEIADKYAPIDYDTQFEKCILGIVNRFAKVLELSELTPKLTFTLSLF
jgi:DNA polymerase elongation subunit (family B)